MRMRKHYTGRRLNSCSMRLPLVVEDLISINQRLQQSDAAWGTLEYAQEHMDLQTDIVWYEKLGRWDEALQYWDQQEEENEPEGKHRQSEIIIRKTQALHALGEWDLLSEYVQDRWNTADAELKRQMAPLAAAASWSLSQWDYMDNYIQAMKADSTDRNFFRAILAVHRNQFGPAQRYIGRARERIDAELTVLAAENYNRAYEWVCPCLSLEGTDVSARWCEYSSCRSWRRSFRTNNARIDRNVKPRSAALGRNGEHEVLPRRLTARLMGSQRDVDTWQRILQLRSLVLSPTEDTDTWIEFAKICRQSDRSELAVKTLTSLVGTDYDAQDPQVSLDSFERLSFSESRQGTSTCDIRVLPSPVGEIRKSWRSQWEAGDSTLSPRLY